MKEQKDRYEIFLKVCETGSFSKAAEALNYTQSGISQMMAGLEEELGVQLFARVKRGVSLTDNGARLIPYIQEMVNQKDKLRQAAFNINNKIEREAVIPTAFEKGASTYPIGMTMDIYEYQGKYGWDPDSVRDEILPGEQELMDDKPVDPSKLRMTAVQCPNCGASYQAAAGYTGRCPYCGSYHNVE